jgi:large subunit ribosomal protein L3
LRSNKKEAFLSDGEKEMTGMLGTKIGMTNIFDAGGRFVPVTLIEAGPCTVLGTKTPEKDGYSALIIGYKEQKEKRLNKAQKTLFKKAKQTPKKHVREIRTSPLSPLKIGDSIAVSAFKVGDHVDVRGASIGKGFQGGMKRWKWSGGGGSHGSMFHRAPGSIGASSYPSRVLKGQHLPGHMGNVKRTMQNLEVIDTDQERNLLMVRGSVPGHKGSLLVVKHAKKMPPKNEEKADTKAKDETTK